MHSKETEGITRKLVGFTLSDRRVPRHDYVIEDAEGNEIGLVTSGTQAPSLGYPIGMGYVQKAFAAVDTEIFIVAGRKKISSKKW